MRSGLKAAGPLLTRARFEVIPASSVEDLVVEWVPRDLTVTVTASPRKGLEATLALTERLAERGYRVVPHVSARLVVDESHLGEIIARLKACGIEDVFVPAGDADPPVGRFDSALSLLMQMDTLGRPFPQMGITGYPESHPEISDDVTVQAMWDKRRYATYIVSNLCFDAATVRRWIRRVRDRGVKLPIYFGLAGPVDRTRLLKVATKIGVGESARFLSGHAGWFLRMGAPGGYDPSRLLERTGGALADPASIIEGLHLFTFNQIRQTEQWRRGVLASLSPEGSSGPQARE
ncbi:MAG: methylenetetrahydrofolate reductase [Acidimicrobiales bacterium]